MPLMRIALRKYPNMIEAMDKRHIMYNQQLAYVKQREQQGQCLVIRPKEKIPIGHFSHDPQQMKLVYDMGRETANEHLQDIRNYYEL